ncbi:MAG: hypothetical protein Q7R30_09620 [Acidobacteriota bacterium]|nr:hypothetical protein [Acidobacteriota bacterium]
MPVFRVGGLAFGIVICNDANYRDPARIMASQGASVLFVPTNCSASRCSTSLNEQLGRD